MIRLLSRMLSRSTHVPALLPYVIIDGAQRAETLRNRLAVLQQELRHSPNPDNIKVQIAVVKLQLADLGVTIINAKI